MTHRPPIAPPDLADLPLELDGVGIRIHADQRLPDEIAAILTGLATEVLADWLAGHVPDLLQRLAAVQVVAIEQATAQLQAAPAEETVALLPSDLAAPTVLIAPGAAYEAAVLRRDAAR